MAPDPFLERINLHSTDKIAKLCEYLSHILNYLLLMIGFAINLANTIMQRQNIVTLVQKIVKILQRTNIDDMTFRKLIKKSRIYCAVEVVTFLSLYSITHFTIAMQSTYYNNNMFNYFLFDFPLLVFHIHIIYSISFVMIMRQIAMEIKKTLRSEDKHNTAIYEIIFKTYVDILDTFQLYKTVFQDLVRVYELQFREICRIGINNNPFFTLQILYFIFIAFFHTLVLIEYTIAQFTTENLLPFVSLPGDLSF